MSKRNRKYKKHHFLDRSAHVEKLTPRKQELPPVDPDRLKPEALELRGRYRDQVEAREARSAKFVPLNQRGAKQDEHGRLVAIDYRDRKPTWLR